MKARHASPPQAPPGRAGRTARATDPAALLILLVCLVARVHLPEVPFRTSNLSWAVAAFARGDNSHDLATVRAEPGRIAFAVLTLAAVAVWLIGRAAAGDLRIRHGWLGLLILAFTGLGLAAALAASDKRSALDAWVEQSSLLAGGFLVAQLCGDRRRFRLVVVVLAGLAAALAVKGFWQLGVEIPARVAAFEEDPARFLAAQGIEPATPNAEMFAARVRDSSLSGYFPLANVFGSMLIVLLAAAAGLAGAKLAAARRAVPVWRRTARRGEVHLPTVAAVIAAGTALPVAAALLLAHSRGAILAAGAGGAAAAAVLVFRRRLARHRRKALAAAACVVLLAAAGVVAYGLRRDRLPTRTMTFRWYYWTASAEIIGERPLLGVGPANFASAYLRHRRPSAEEAVKMPHNVLLHAAAEYGLPGGACYVAVLIGMLVVASRPGAANEAEVAGPRARPARRAAVIALLAGGAIAARALLADASAGAEAMLIDAVLPGAVLAVALVAAWWSGGGANAFVAPAARVALVCGAAAFVLHNTVSLSLWMPGAAMVFWVAAGACAGQAPGREHRLSGARWAAAAGGVAALTAAIALLLWPVWRRSRLTEQLTAALARGDLAAALAYEASAVGADPIDPLAPADAAKVLRLAATVAPTPRAAAGYQTRALELAREAIQRDPENSGRFRSAAEIQHERALATGAAPVLRADAAELALNAVTLDPQNARLRIQCARILLDAGRRVECLRQLAQAERVDAALEPQSTLRLGGRERGELAAMRARAEGHPPP